jgi:hypothetical protein
MYTQGPEIASIWYRHLILDAINAKYSALPRLLACDEQS